MTNTWLNRWNKNQIGWHQQDGHASIDRYWQPSDGPVLVPLCGKSYDLLKLANRGHQVSGVELSEKAAECFFVDHELDFRVFRGRWTEYCGTDVPIKIVVADFFDYDETGFSSVFDRAALIALPQQQRAAYAQHVKQRLSSDAFHLLISIDYDQALIDGPPFAVAPAEIEGLYPNLECVDSYGDLENSPGKFVAAGVTELRESVWRSKD